MKIGTVLSRAFKGLKSGPMWGFFATAVLAAAVPFALIAVVSRAFFAGAAMRWFGAPAVEGLGPLSEFAALYATLILGMLLALPVVIILQAGLVHMSDGVLAGRTVRVSDGWSFGLRRFGRTFGIEALVYVGYLMAIAVALVPFFLLVFAGLAVTGGGADSDNPAGLLGGMCLGYLWLFVAILVAVFIYVAVRSLALRYALIGDRGVMDALSAAFKAVRHAFKHVFVFTLAMLAIMYAYQAVTSIVLAPLYLVVVLRGAGADDPQAIVTLMWLLYPASILLYLPMTLFNALAWTSFFRSLTGMEEPVPQPAYAQQPTAYPPAYGAQYPSAPPTPPSPPVPPAPPADPGSDG